MFPNLRELIAKDAAVNLRDTAAFASEHEINGVKLPVILDSEKVQAYNLQAMAAGLYQVELFYYITQEDAEKLPEPLHKNDHQSFDGVGYMIEEVRPEGASLIVTLRSGDE